MELEEMKHQWDEMSEEIKKQKILTNKLIVDMIQEKFTNRLRRISVPETIGTFICFGMALYVVLNFSKLDTWYLQLSGIFAVVFCVVLPILSLKSIYGMRKIIISTSNYKETIENFVKRKKQFVLVQKWSFYLSFVLVVVSLPVASKLMKGKDLFLESTVWLWYLPIGFLFLYFFSKWIFKHYKKTTKSAEELLKELEVS